MNQMVPASMGTILVIFSSNYIGAVLYVVLLRCLRSLRSGQMWQFVRASHSLHHALLSRQHTPSRFRTTKLGGNRKPEGAAFIEFAIETHFSAHQLCVSATKR
jgi:hypothetical protein